MKYLSIHPADFNFFLIRLMYYCCHTHCRLLCYSFMLSSIPAFVEQMLLPYLDSHLIRRLLKDWENVNIIFSPFFSSFSPENVAWNGDLLEVGYWRVLLKTTLVGEWGKQDCAEGEAESFSQSHKELWRLDTILFSPNWGNEAALFYPHAGQSFGCNSSHWMQQASRKEM